MVIVHENRDILTHNSRRYLVLCTFTPQLYSLTASASVPAHLLRKVIDRLRERRLPFQVELLATGNSRRSGGGGGGDEEAKAKAERRKQLKKRHSSTTTSSTTTPPPRAKTFFSAAQSANLRDSRMLAEEDSGGSKRMANKWAKGGENHHRQSYASSSIISAAVACLTALALVGLLLRGRDKLTTTSTVFKNKDEAFSQEIANKRSQHEKSSEKKVTVE